MAQPIYNVFMGRFLEAWYQLLGFFAIAKRELNMLKRMICSIILLAGVTVMLARFGRATEPLKIGMVSTLTGVSAEGGLYETQGAKLAAEEVNKAPLSSRPTVCNLR